MATGLVNNNPRHDLTKEDQSKGGKISGEKKKLDAIYIG